ncbi:MAG: hypothetical protein ACKVQR_05865 [Aquabacterium sp.]
MAIVALSFRPTWPMLKVVQGSYGSSESRLDFAIAIIGSDQVEDQNGRLLSSGSWNIRIHDEGSTVRAENDQQGAGSIRYRPPSPTDVDSPGGCVIQVDLAAAGFASLVAACIAGRLPSSIDVEVDGLDGGADHRWRWDRAAQPALVVTSFRFELDLVAG